MNDPQAVVHESVVETLKAEEEARIRQEAEAESVRQAEIAAQKLTEAKTAKHNSLVAEQITRLENILKAKFFTLSYLKNIGKLSNKTQEKIEAFRACLDKPDEKDKLEKAAAIPRSRVSFSFFSSCLPFFRTKATKILAAKDEENSQPSATT